MIALGLLLLAVVLLAGTLSLTGFLALKGQLRWTPQVSRATKGITSAGLLLTLGASIVLFGVTSLLAIWPILLGLVALVFGPYFVLDFITAFRPEGKASAAPAPSPNAVWDSLWRSYEGKPLPPWMLDAAMQGNVVYDGGKRATVVNGVLTPKRDTPSLSLESLFQKMDKFLG